MLILRNIRTLYTCRDEGAQDDVHAIDDAALAWRGDGIAWVGAERDLPTFDDAESYDARGGVVIPGLIDCHTHLAFGGWRADEFGRRCRGESYLEIARGGGGIAKTVRQTREASTEELESHATSYLDAMAALGVTTVECKSGYGLTVADELRLLEVYRRLDATHPTRIVPTLLGAHVVPVEFAQDRAGYVELLCDDLIPAAAERGLARFNDVFVESGAFSVDEARRVLEAGRVVGLEPKLHVDQLGDGGGAALAAEVEAVSADHLEYASHEGIDRLAAAGVVAVALPIASLYLRQQPMDARRFLDAGVSVAVATDFNPGSAPSYCLPLAMTLACTMNRLTPREALKAATIYAARALRLERDVGSLESGKSADFVVLEAPDVEHWLYQAVPSRPGATAVGGRYKEKWRD